MSLVHSPNEVVAQYTAKVPVDLVGLVNELGLKLHLDSFLPRSVSGKLVRDASAPAGYKIVVNANDNSRRQRFTMAHEVAHYVLHRDLLSEDIVDDALYRSSALSDPLEREADRFAGQILLPANAVRMEYKKDKALARLASLFDVSDSALRIRLKELRLGA